MHKNKKKSFVWRRAPTPWSIPFRPFNEDAQASDHSARNVFFLYLGATDNKVAQALLHICAYHKVISTLCNTMAQNEHKRHAPC